MAEVQEAPQAPHERKPRKSVAFSGEDTIMDEAGEISEAPTNTAEDQPTAEKHSSSPEDKAVDEVTDMFAGLNKKKKKSSKPKIEDGATADADAPAPVDAEFDPTALKKKKKKSTKKVDGEDFAAKLASAGLDGPGEDGEQPSTTEEQQSGDMTAGTGIWSHDSGAPISYDLLLKRFFQLVNEHNPDILSSGSKSYKIPPPQCLREGNKKTIFANIAEICKRMNRNDEHVTQFLFAELGTSGSVDGSKRLVIKGRFQQKQIENVLRRYIVEYVTCKTCRSPNTELSKGENRLYFVTCNSCGSRRSVTAIKSGFTAQVGKRKRMQG
ncbi:translation initiation factor eIF-2 beta subunit [Exophiala viscosa]|uniref:Translation initiation factor eIF-2 beta subunit n=1 Tax=Exophiala viscosa TaxID=2486360 RepID=A0AAN6I9C4_9EURO|nr:translation initiation factor eIF-2 beta subunit [Exophiala viscosa]KAI1620865.1 translation initiation factor eIF-2 beta subunit [Exophiala viscosa]